MRILIIGEGQTPIPMFMDPFCEELAFPTIWFGHPRGTPPSNVRLSFDDFVNSEIRRSDRRACRPDHLLFLHKKSQIAQLMRQVNIVLRKSAQTNNITAADVMNQQFIDNAIMRDNAYKFMSSITGSPAYWENQKKKVLAMVRQLGTFTIFLTLSAAETHWGELLSILKRTVDKEIVSIEDAAKLTFEEKARLIRTDPVTCAQYFDHRFKHIRKAWTNVENGPFGNYRVVHYFYRIEFQHRGSPHVHMVLWLQDAPIYDVEKPESEQSVVEFIDTLITTDGSDPEMQNLIKFQFHKCSFTCKRVVKGVEVCRFNAPFYPMDRTRVIEPIPKDAKFTADVARKMRKIKKDVDELLRTDMESIDSFEKFLEKLGCTLDEYITVVRIHTKHRKIYLKRNPKDNRINAYNKKILMMMRSNMDIQYVLDVYSCIGYVVDYINKSSRGLSRLLRQCVEDSRRGNHNLRVQLRSLSQILYNSSETSAQEAAWCRCRLPMACTSVFVEFISSGPVSVNILKYEQNLNIFNAKFYLIFRRDKEC